MCSLQPSFRYNRVSMSQPPRLKVERLTELEKQEKVQNPCKSSQKCTKQLLKGSRVEKTFSNDEIAPFGDVSNKNVTSNEDM
jgi:hypothetical protein